MPQSDGAVTWGSGGSGSRLSCGAGNVRGDDAPFDGPARAPSTAPRGRADNDTEPQAANVPAAGSHVDAGEFLAAQARELVAIDNRREGEEVGCGCGELTNGERRGRGAERVHAHLPLTISSCVT